MGGGAWGERGAFCVSGGAIVVERAEINRESIGGADMEMVNLFIRDL